MYATLSGGIQGGIGVPSGSVPIVAFILSYLVRSRLSRYIDNKDASDDWSELSCRTHSFHSSILHLDRTFKPCIPNSLFARPMALGAGQVPGIGSTDSRFQPWQRTKRCNRQSKQSDSPSQSLMSQSSGDAEHNDGWRSGP